MLYMSYNRDTVLSALYDWQDTISLFKGTNFPASKINILGVKITKNKLHKGKNNQLPSEILDELEMISNDLSSDAS